MKKLEPYGGQGYAYASEDGIFEVRSENGKFTFTSLSQAIQYYNSLQIGKALWDISGVPELLECHILIEDETTLIPKPKFKIGDIVELKPKYVKLEYAPKRIKILKVYMPPYRGFKQYGYSYDYLTKWGWQYIGHRAALSLEKEYDYAH